MTKKLKPAIAYVRVSTEGQQKHGSGLDLQRTRIREFARHAGYEIVEEFSDAQTAMGSKSVEKREGLRKAVILARDLNAPILVDGWSRFSRNVQALEDILKQGRLSVISCDPGENGSYAAAMGYVARRQHEGENIGQRTKEALDRLREQGVRLGNHTNLDEARRAAAVAKKENVERQAADLAPVVRELRQEGRTKAHEIAEGLNIRGSRTARGGEWHADNIRRLLKRVDELDRAAQDAENTQNPNWGVF